MSLILGLPMMLLFAVAICLVLIACRLCLRLAEYLFPIKPDRTAPPDPRCAGCNYNLRGTIDAQRNHCPECGEAIDLRLVYPPR